MKRVVHMKAPDPFAILKDVKVPVLIACVSFVGGIIVSFIGPYLAAQHQTAKDITDRRVAIYQKFFSGQAKLLQTRYGDLSKEEKDRLTREYQQEIKEARFEIGAFGSPEVIEALVNWFRIVAVTNKKDASLWKEDVKIYQAMRNEIFGKQKAQVKDADLYDLLFRYGNAPGTEQK
jgi:hypothetical protein